MALLAGGVPINGVPSNTPPLLQKGGGVCCYGDLFNVEKSQNLQKQGAAAAWGLLLRGVTRNSIDELLDPELFCFKFGRLEHSRCVKVSPFMTLSNRSIPFPGFCYVRS